MDFAHYLAEQAPVINRCLDTYFGDNPDHADINRYLIEPLGDFNANGGKRHRPAICLLACELVGGNPADAMSAAAAIELFQTAALVHDDIADDGQLRRGKPCLHITQGVGLAINGGDYALTLAYDAVANCDALDDAVKVEVIRELVAMMRRTAEGQALDIGWAHDGRYDQTVEDYLVMARHKTATYSCAAPLVIGALIGKGSREQIEALREFGMACGLAFQIQDDLLNVVGTAEATRKDFRCDITEGKRTLLVCYALAHSCDASELKQLLASHTRDASALDRATGIMQECGAVDYARSYALELVASAKAELVKVFDRKTDQRELLLDMADFFVSRIS